MARRPHRPMLRTTLYAEKENTLSAGAKWQRRHVYIGIGGGVAESDDLSALLRKSKEVVARSGGRRVLTSLRVIARALLARKSRPSAARESVTKCEEVMIKPKSTHHASIEATLFDFVKHARISMWWSVTCVLMAYALGLTNA